MLPVVEACTTHSYHWALKVKDTGADGRIILKWNVDIGRTDVEWIHQTQHND